MSDDEIKIVIAKACGRNGWWCPQCKMLVSEHSLGYQNRHANCTDSAQQAPNYSADLNATHEMEKRLGLNALVEYADNLEKICVPVHVCSLTHWADVVMATARQRAEAFIKTVCPEKWTND